MKRTKTNVNIDTGWKFKKKKNDHVKFQPLDISNTYIRNPLINRRSIITCFEKRRHLSSSSSSSIFSSFLCTFLFFLDCNIHILCLFSSDYVVRDQIVAVIFLEKNMDQFGVLVERYGVKVQGGKSTPMANLKAKANSTNGFPSNLGFNSGQNSGDPFANDLDGFFTSHNYNDNDIFGGVFANSKQQQNNVDIESVLGVSSSANKNNANDDFDLFGMEPNKSDSIDDLFGDLGLKSDGPKKDPAGNRAEIDDLIPGFGDFSSPTYR